MKTFVIGLAVATALAGCSSAGTKSLKANTTGIPTGEGRLAGRVGPGSPPAGTVPPSLVLTFAHDAVVVTATATGGTYQVDLTPGMWSVRSADGRACATGLHVSADGWQRTDLVYPLVGCQNLVQPEGPGPTPPSAP